MADTDFYTSLIDNAPQGMFQLGDDNHLANMSNFSAYINAVGGDPTKPTNPNIKLPVLPQSELDKFGNWTGQTDTKVMAQDLMDKGLMGANQLKYDNPDISTSQGITNAQSDWKVAAIQQILANARKFNFHTPEEVNANKDVLIGNSKWVDAINNSSFKQIHPNFWSVITDKLLPDQWAKLKKEKQN